MLRCETGNPAHMGPHHVAHLFGAFILRKDFCFLLKQWEGFSRELRRCFYLPRQFWYVLRASLGKAWIPEHSMI